MRIILKLGGKGVDLKRMLRKSSVTLLTSLTPEREVSVFGNVEITFLPEFVIV